jgi:voltage-dependent potassium channel beta subunit
VRYRQVGRSGLRVSEVGLGSWLTYGNSVGIDCALDCIKSAYDHGVNFFDTANEYAHGKAEEVLGRALSTYERSSLVIATKVFQPMGDGPNDRGLSRKHIMEQVDASLRRLNVDYIDLYQCHRFDPTVPLDETCRAMDDLVRAGKIIYWGVSEWSREQLVHAAAVCKAMGAVQPISNQPQYSLLWRHPEDEVFPTCRTLGLGTLAWAPLAMGVLTGKYRPDSPMPSDSRGSGSGGEFMRAYLQHSVLDRVARADDIARRAGCSLSQVALAWCLRTSAISAAIVGASRPQHVVHAAEAAHLDIDDEVLNRIGAVLAPAAFDVHAQYPVDRSTQANGQARQKV